MKKNETSVSFEHVLLAVQQNQKSIDQSVRNHGASSGKKPAPLPAIDSLENIPPEISSRHPLITIDSYNHLKTISENQNAPRWNYFTIGDHVNEDDLRKASRFRTQFFASSYPSNAGPSEEIIRFAQAMRDRSKWFFDSIPHGCNLLTSWNSVRTMCRKDLAGKLLDIVPVHDSYDRLIVYDTSGTTGHSIVVPHHPQTLAMNHVFAEYALKAYGKLPEFKAGMTACVNVCAQQNTYVFCNIFSVWNGAGFAKVNLRAADWSTGIDGAGKFFKDLNPHFITADPITISEMIEWNLPIRPAAIFSTALTLSESLSKRAEEVFQCPVINWYSTTETGPIAFVPPHLKNENHSFEIFGPDIFVEVLNEHGFPCETGEIGEITVTGGRNPWLPLLRYRTGDYGQLSEDGTTIEHFQGRAPVVFRATDSSIVNSVDIGRCLRIVCPFIQHQFIQNADRTCRLLVHPLPGINVNTSAIESAVKELFGEEQSLSIEIVPTPSEKQLIPFVSYVC